MKKDMGQNMNELKEKAKALYADFKAGIMKDKRRLAIFAGAAVLLIGGIGTAGYLYATNGPVQKVAVVGEDTVSVKKGASSTTQKDKADTKKDAKDKPSEKKETKDKSDDKKDDKKGNSDKDDKSDQGTTDKTDKSDKGTVDKKGKSDKGAADKTSSSTDSKSSGSSSQSTNKSSSTASKNTGSTSASSSGSSSSSTSVSSSSRGSSSSNATTAKPAEPEKKKKPIYGTKSQWKETKAAWDEKIEEPVYDDEPYYECRVCGSEIAANDEAIEAHGAYHAEREEPFQWWERWRKVKVDTKTRIVHHDAEGHWEDVEDRDNIIGWE